MLLVRFERVMSRKRLGNACLARSIQDLFSEPNDVADLDSDAGLERMRLLCCILVAERRPKTRARILSVVLSIIARQPEIVTMVNALAVGGQRWVLVR